MSDPIDLNVKNFVRLVLFHQCKKIPIKKEEIVSKCILFCHFLVKINSQTFENILPKVKAILCDTFGFNLIELPFIASKTQASNNQSRKATLQATGKNSNQYTILSKFPQKVIEKESDLIERGILGFLVCILTLNNGSMESDVLFDILKKYDLTGAFDESLGDFVKQKYFIKENVEDYFILRVGPRCVVEFPPEIISELICALTGDMQYREKISKSISYGNIE